MFVRLPFLLLIAAASTWAQAGSRISGIVFDNSEAAVPGAEVTLTEVRTRVALTPFPTKLAGIRFPICQSAITSWPPGNKDSRKPSRTN